MNAVALRLLVGLYFTEVKIESETERQGALWLEEIGLIETCGTNAIVITAKGHCHVKALLEAPLPNQIWSSPLCSN